MLLNDEELGMVAEVLYIAHSYVNAQCPFVLLFELNVDNIYI
jgi:hypothetical protein